jgi:DNA-binding GntR family transcriptional regulator
MNSRVRIIGSTFGSGEYTSAPPSPADLPAPFRSPQISRQPTRPLTLRAGEHTVYSMQSTPRIDRPNLSAQAADAIRRRVVHGAIPPGVRINEVHLAAELGVSRTPLREALMRLVAEGSIEIEPRRGFFARPLTVTEFQQIAPIRALLDPAALEISGLPARPQLERLRNLNRQFEAARDPERIIALDDTFHLELVAGCTNTVLLDLIRQFMNRTHRYELVLMNEVGGVQRASDDHAKILAALAAKDLPRACKALRHNMQSGTEAILAWLEKRSPQ